MMILAGLNAIFYAKYNFLYFLASKEPTDFIDFGYWMTVLAIVIGWVLLWTKYSERVDCLLNSIEFYEDNLLGNSADETEGSTKQLQTFVYWVVGFEVVSLVAALCKSVFYETLWGWSLQITILDLSDFVAEALFNWDLQTSDYWQTTYGQKLTATNITLGCFGLLIEFCYRLLMIVIKDTILILIITLSSCVQAFIARISDFANLPFEDVREEDCLGMETHYETYLRVKDIVLDMNWAFGGLIIMLHVGNELFLAYFMKSCLEDPPAGALLIWMLFTVVKVIYGYIQASLIYRYVIKSYQHVDIRAIQNILI